MTPTDLPREITQATALPRDALLAAVREVAQGPLARQVLAIDREGLYPKEVLQQLAAVGGMSAHLDSAGGTGDFFLSIQAMAEVSRVCGATGFMMWCQAVAGLYMQQSGNPALMGEVLARHVSGQTLGGTALSNPMKSYAQIESLLLKASPVEGGYLVNGTLPWVSDLGPDHYCGAIAAVAGAPDEPPREMMFLLRCDAPGVELRNCPSFSAMEGTGTYALRLKDCFVGAGDIIADPGPGAGDDAAVAPEEFTTALTAREAGEITLPSQPANPRIAVDIDPIAQVIRFEWPVLKSKVQGWLVQKNEVLAFVQARADEGGAGALVVLLKPG